MDKSSKHIYTCICRNKTDNVLTYCSAIQAYLDLKGLKWFEHRPFNRKSMFKSCLQQLVIAQCIMHALEKASFTLLSTVWPQAASITIKNVAPGETGKLKKYLKK